MMQFLKTLLVTADEFALAARKTGAVYFAKDDRSDTIKIGFSRNPWERLATLQVANASSLKFIGLIAGDRRIEKSIHENLSEGHIRGEWFIDSGMITDWLDRMTQGHPIGRHVWTLIPARMSFAPSAPVGDEHLVKHRNPLRFFSGNGPDQMPERP